MSKSNKAWVIWSVICLTYYLVRLVVLVELHIYGTAFYLTLLNLGIYIFIIRIINKEVEESIEREAWIRSLYP